ncbi:zinc ion binding protein [Arabidopsis lyrata subsp. lyrata]|uniref:Zinc ion binding protein n=1 Tax=Arabidopsis lyrata subsp. lyrata TaxID=81972 RepID=D7MRM3_ARALL|nr:zinc ion binding protein [Arabidopsis lyrata subsp. lyrata]
MSCNSRNSNVESGGCNSGMISNVEAGGFNSRGFPVKCKCGLDVVMLTSSTAKNPGRPFFRCKSCKDDHFFKWVEDCMYEEVVDALPKISSIDNEIINAKAEVAVEIANLKELMIEEIQRWKKMTKVCLVCLCFSVIAIVISMFYKTKNQKFVLGY